MNHRPTQRWSATLPTRSRCAHNPTVHLFLLLRLSFFLTGYPYQRQAPSLVSLSLSPSCSHPWPVPCLGFTYLGHSSSTMSLCRYFRQRACLDEPSYAYLQQKWARKQFRPKSDCKHAAREWIAVAVDLSEQEPRARGQSVNGRSQSDYFPLFFFLFFSLLLVFFFKCICICTDHRRIENVRCYGRDGRVGASWLADWFYCSTTTWSLVSLAVIVGSAAICCFE